MKMKFYYVCEMRKTSFRKYEICLNEWNRLRYQRSFANPQVENSIWKELKRHRITIIVAVTEGCEYNRIAYKDGILDQQIERKSWTFNSVLRSIPTISSLFRFSFHKIHNNIYFPIFSSSTYHTIVCIIMFTCTTIISVCSIVTLLHKMYTFWILALFEQQQANE